MTAKVAFVSALLDSIERVPAGDPVDSRKLLIFGSRLSLLNDVERMLQRRGYVIGPGPLINPEQQGQGSQGSSQGPIQGIKKSHSSFCYYRIDGAVRGSDLRGSIVDAFNAEPRAVVMLLSFKTGSLGINLTSSNRVVLLDNVWNPVYGEQAVRRIARLGQTRATHVYRLMYEGTAESVIRDNNVSKEVLFDHIVNRKAKSRQRGKDNDKAAGSYYVKVSGSERLSLSAAADGQDPKGEGEPLHGPQAGRACLLSALDKLSESASVAPSAAAETESPSESRPLAAGATVATVDAVVEAVAAMPHVTARIKTAAPYRMELPPDPLLAGNSTEEEMAEVV